MFKPKIDEEITANKETGCTKNTKGTGLMDQQQGTSLLGLSSTVIRRGRSCDRGQTARIFSIKN